MQFSPNLKSLFPTLIELVNENDHEYYGSEPTHGEDGFMEYESTPNTVIYEEDGWCIEIEYSWYGNSGRVSDIRAYYADITTGSELDCRDEDIDELWGLIDKTLSYSEFKDKSN